MSGRKYPSFISLGCLFANQLYNGCILLLGNGKGSSFGACDSGLSKRPKQLDPPHYRLPSTLCLAVLLPELPQRQDHRIFHLNTHVVSTRVLQIFGLLLVRTSRDTHRHTQLGQRPALHFWQPPESAELKSSLPNATPAALRLEYLQRHLLGRLRLRLHCRGFRHLTRI